jgi:metal-responsive CopG/Arc/MetJ family transcriptional regulator
MKTLSIKIEDDIFNETEEIISKLKLSRNRYINEAIRNYNRVNNRIILKKQLALESKLIKKESIKILHKFEMFED